MAISAAQIRAASAYVEVTLRDNLVTKQLKALENKLRKFGNEMRNLGTKLFGAGVGGLVPFGLSLRTFGDFDNLIQEFRAIAKVSTVSLDRIENKIKRLGRTTSFTASEIAEAAVVMSRLGFDTKQIDDSLASVTALARATRTELGRATQIAGDLMKSFGVETKNADKFIDQIVYSTNTSSQNLEQLFESLKNFGPQAKNVGLMVEQVLALNAALADAGIKGTLAGTMVRRMLTNLTDSARRDYLKETFGIETLDVDGNLRPVLDIIEELDIAMKTFGLGSGEKASVLNKIFEVRGSAAALITGRNIASIRATANELANIGNVAQKTAEQIDQGLGNRFKILLSALQGVGIAIGEALKKPIVDLIGVTSIFLDKLTQFIEKNHDLVRDILLTTVVFAGLGGTLLALSATSFVVASGLGLIRSAVSAAVLPVTMLVKVLSKLTTSMIYVIEGLKKFRFSFVGLKGPLQKTGSVLLTTVSGAFSRISRVVAQAVDFIVPYLKIWKQQIVIVGSALEPVVVRFTKLFKILRDFVQIKPAIGGKLFNTAQLQQQLVLLRKLRGTYVDLVSDLKNVVRVFGLFSNLNFHVGLIAIKEAFRGIGTVGLKSLQAIFRVARGVSVGFFAITKQLIKALPSLVLMELIFKSVEGAIFAVRSAIENAIKSFAGFGEAVGVAFQNVTLAINSGDFESAVKSVVLIVENLFLRIKRFFVGFSTDIRNGFEEFIEPFKTIGQTIKNIFKRIFTGLNQSLPGVANFLGQLSGFFSDFAINASTALLIAENEIGKFGDFIASMSERFDNFQYRGVFLTQKGAEQLVRQNLDLFEPQSMKRISELSKRENAGEDVSVQRAKAYEDLKKEITQITKAFIDPLRPGPNARPFKDQVLNALADKRFEQNKTKRKRELEERIAELELKQAERIKTRLERARKATESIDAAIRKNESKQRTLGASLLARPFLEYRDSFIKSYVTPKLDAAKSAYSTVTGSSLWKFLPQALGAYFQPWGGRTYGLFGDMTYGIPNGKGGLAGFGASLAAEFLPGLFGSQGSATQATKLMASLASAGGFNPFAVSQSARGDRVVDVQKEILEKTKEAAGFLDGINEEMKRVKKALVGDA